VTDLSITTMKKMEILKNAKSEIEDLRIQIDQEVVKVKK
jgi:hypothetical protein